MPRSVRAALLIARREFVERGSSRAFLVSNAILLVALVVAIAVPAGIGGDDGARRLGFVPDAEQTAQLAERQAPSFNLSLELVGIDDRADAQAALDAGGDREPVDAVLLDRGQVLVNEELDGELEPLLTTAARSGRVEELLADSDLDQTALEDVLAPQQLQVEALDPPEEAEEGPALAVAAIAVFSLYGLLLFYGNFVAQGIVEEKSSRVVEVLLSTVRPTSLLYGKILGLVGLGLVQTLALAVVGLAAAVVLLDLAVPGEAYLTVVLAVAWFVLGFFLYATLYAVAASLVSRQEDLQSTVFPVLVPIIASFFIAQYSLTNPESTVSLVGGLVPFTAPLVQPLRYGAGVGAAWEVPVAIVLCLATIALLVPLAARFYSGSALRFGGRVGLAEAWRAARS